MGGVAEVLWAMTTSDRSPALPALDVLVGEWNVRPTPPPEWGVTDPDSMTCSVTTFDWALGGAYLMARSHPPTRSRTA